MKVEKTKNRKTLIIVGAVVVLIIIGVIANRAGGGNEDVEGALEFPLSSYNVEGENYQDIELQLQSAGFTNITTEAIADLVTGLLSDDGDVKEVSVNGKTEFSEGDKFAADAKIVIRYHTFPEGEAASTEPAVDGAATDGSAADSAAADGTAADDAAKDDTDTSGSDKNVFSPKDVSDETISSIQTYDDYLVMFKAIVDDYLANYEAAIKGTALYSKESFQAIKDEYSQAYEEQKKEYASMGDKKIVGKDTLVEFLIGYRDSLKELTDSVSEALQ